jgi:hypothetical protein
MAAPARLLAGLTCKVLLQGFKLLSSFDLLDDWPSCLCTDADNEKM